MDELETTLFEIIYYLSGIVNGLFLGYIIWVAP